jgi:hypothetical protein
MTIPAQYCVKIKKYSYLFEIEGLIGKIYIDRRLLELFGKNRQDLASGYNLRPCLFGYERSDALRNVRARKQAHVTQGCSKAIYQKGYTGFIHIIPMNC